MNLLNVKDLSISFGGLKAVSNFSIEIPLGGLYGLIGPNGAGKTTIFNLLTGVYTPDHGTFELDGKSLKGFQNYKISQMGVARTFQNIRLFSELTVLENIRVAYAHRVGLRFLGVALGSAFTIQQEKKITQEAITLLNKFNLSSRKDELAKNLPYGDQRRLEIARALATKPKLLLLDEPAAGMNPKEKLSLRELIQDIRRDFGVTILLIEHDMGLVMDICEKITVIDHGAVIANGTSADIQSNPQVIEAYLGLKSEEAS